MKNTVCAPKFKTPTVCTGPKQNAKESKPAKSCMIIASSAVLRCYKKMEKKIVVENAAKRVRIKTSESGSGDEEKVKSASDRRHLAALRRTKNRASSECIRLLSGTSLKSKVSLLLWQRESVPVFQK